jgi:hypothetical protein
MLVPWWRQVLPGAGFFLEPPLWAGVALSGPEARQA